MNLKLKKIDIIEIKNKINHYHTSRAAVIDALKIVQNRIGWVPDWGIHEVSKILNLSYSEVESIATFYSQIFRKEVGNNIIRYCDSVVCYIKGYKKIEKKLEDILKIKTGCTTIDKKFTLLPVCCIGNCDKAPTFMVNKELYSNVKITSIKKILGLYI
ncbi:NADH-quinone oxidoreductase subunit NuoE [Buchnera aphidicola (Kurisakia onigurumii)]|uniref:NADH-quinone oxidoreductase subunit NuoE n=1 Tax=Buchnera aphidicola TaxID=9 RepID=UPI0031B67C1A